MPQCYPQGVAKLLIEFCCCFPLQLISSVWSPQSIEFSLQQFCLPFLRLSCLLQHHLYGDNLTGCQVPCICILVVIITTLKPVEIRVYDVWLVPKTNEERHLCAHRKKMSSQPWLHVWDSTPQSHNLLALLTVPHACSGQSTPLTW